MHHVTAVGRKFGRYKLQDNLIYIFIARINHCNQKNDSR